MQRGLHREMQAIFLLLTRRSDISIVLFSIIFLPGVFLHECSHYLVAHILGVGTGRFSLIPHPTGDGRIQLGSVETAKTDFVRDTLIGMAPLLVGCAFVAYTGLARWQVTDIWRSIVNLDSTTTLAYLGHLYEKSDFWLWLYLTLTVSSTMFPSETDRRAWLPFTLFALMIVGLGLLAGLGPWMNGNILPIFERILQALNLVIGLSLIIHIISIIPVSLIRSLLSRLTGLKVV